MYFPQNWVFGSALSKLQNSVRHCRTSTSVVFPDTLYPIPSNSATLKTLENTGQAPDDPTTDEGVLQEHPLISGTAQVLEQ
jgi:hypothetical protein